MKWLIGFAFYIIVFTLFGCHILEDKTSPAELTGVWETSDPRYEDCSFELKGDMIIFNNYPEYTSINYISDIERSPETDGVLYHIDYEDKEGLEYKFSFYFVKGHDGDVIRFKNQKEITWTRQTGQPD